MAAEPAPSSRGPTRGSPDDPWLALGAASRLVGVGPETLRRWADSDKIESYTTPGGHRRFLRSSLEAMVNAPRRGGDVCSNENPAGTPEGAERRCLPSAGADRSTSGQAGTEVGGKFFELVSLVSEDALVRLRLRGFTPIAKAAGLFFRSIILIEEPILHKRYYRIMVKGLI